MPLSGPGASPSGRGASRRAGPSGRRGDAFVGSRCVVVEGVRVEEGAVLGANVVLTGSTRIIDVTGEEEVVYRGRVPARSVVIAGTRTREFPAGSYGVQTALIVGERRESTDRKTSLNEALREFGVGAGGNGCSSPSSSSWSARA